MHNIPHTKEAKEKIRLARARQIFTEETKRKISKALKGRTAWNKGKKMSDEFREKRSILSRESWKNPEIRKKRMAKLKGRKVSDEAKKRIGEGNKKNWENKSLEYKKQIGEKFGEFQKKLWQNPKYRKKMSDVHKGNSGYWKNKKRPELTGKKCHLWRGGLTKFKKQIRESIEYKQWRKDIFKRDNWICQHCKVRGGRLQADHYPKSFAKIIKENNIKTLEQALQCKELWSLKNGRTLCEECHKKTDSYLNRWG